MLVQTHLQLMFIFVILIIYSIGQGEISANRHRRQAGATNNRNLGLQPGNPNGLMPTNNLQQSNKNLLPPSQGQTGRDFYSSPDFKPPSFNGEKPLGWFDTKYQNWVSNQDGQINRVDGKNAPPSSLQGKPIPSLRQDNGAFFLEKLGKQYAGKGEKSYNTGPAEYRKGHHSVCNNRQSYDGFMFNRFYCPLPSNTGMNQQDRFCCGIANYQYCCNEQEYKESLGGENFYGKRRPYSSTNRNLAVVLPIISLIVIAAAGAIIYVYYQKMRNARNKTEKTPNTEDYAEVPQESPAERPVVPPRRQVPDPPVET